MVDAAFAAGFCLILLAFGRLVFDRLTTDLPATPAERLLFGFGTGAIALGLLFFLFGVLGWFSAPLLLTATGFAAAVSLFQWPGIFRDAAACLRGEEVRPPVTLLVGLGLVLVPTLSLALVPPFAKDALVYHLTVPKLYLAAGGFRWIAGNIYANFPMGVEILYLPAMAIGLDRVPALIHVAFFAAACLALYRLCRLFTGRAIATLLTLVFAWTPSVFLTAGVPYVDLAVVFYVLGATVALARLARDDDGRWAIAAGLFAGGALTAKYTGAFSIVAGVPLLLWIARRGGKSTRDALLRVAGFAAASAVGLPWLIKNVVLTGNPVYPFLYSVFGGRGWDAFQAEVFELFLDRYGMGKSPVDLLLLPIRLSLQANWDYHAFDGRIGLMYLPLLVALPVLAFMRSGRAKDLAVQVVGFSWIAFGLFWVAATHQVRFLFPALALFLATLAAFWPSGDSRRARRWIAVLLVPIALSGLVLATPRLAMVQPHRFLSGTETREDFLKRGFPLYDFIRFINANTPSDSKVLLLQTGNRGYYLEREFYSDSVTENAYFARKVEEASNAPDLARLLRADGFTHVFANRRFVRDSFQDKNAGRVELFFRNVCTPLVEREPFSLCRIEGQGG